MLQNNKKNIDLFFMQKAISQAKRSFEKNEVPIGAVVVGPDGKSILSQAHNLVEKRNCQTAHAELIAIEKACKKINDWRLNHYTIYVTLEPCAMCMNLILLSRIKTLVFSIQSKKYGYRIDKYNAFELYKSSLFIKEGICAQESLNLLTDFFKQKRKVKQNE